MRDVSFTYFASKHNFQTCMHHRTICSPLLNNRSKVIGSLLFPLAMESIKQFQRSYINANVTSFNREVLSLEGSELRVYGLSFSRALCGTSFPTIKLLQRGNRIAFLCKGFFFGPFLRRWKHRENGPKKARFESQGPMTTTSTIGSLGTPRRDW